jgi:glycosyltransferase involved in cell wall biosynthesis
MRVLFLITRAHEGGAQEHVLTLMRGLSGRVEMHLGTGERGYLTEGAERLGVPVHIVPDLTTAISPRKDWRAHLQVRELLRSVRPDLIHTHSFKSGALGRIAAKSLGIPSIFTAHGWAFADGVPAGQRVIAVVCETLLARITTRIVTVSEADYRLGLRFHVAASPQMVTVRNGVDPLPASAHRSARAVPRIVMVARFQPPKEQTLLLHALRQLDDPFELEFIGDGPLRDQVQAEAVAMGLGDRVRFAGTCRNVPELLDHADIFVLTSRYEGLPMSILEAMRAGLPVVATDAGGVSEAVAEGETGYLIPRGDCSLLRMRLTELLTNREQRLRMGLKGRQRFEKEFSSRIMIESTRSLYEQISGRTVAAREVFAHSVTESR